MVNLKISIPTAKRLLFVSFSAILSTQFGSALAQTSTTTAFSKCADEGQTCSFSGTQQVRYGAAGKFSYQTATGSIQCSNSIFGDPAYGIVKSCEVSASTASSGATTSVPAATQSGAGTTFSKCADEGGTCSFSGTQQVRYGAGGQFAYQTANGSIQCDNAVFGDPAFGVAKTCEVSGVALSSNPTTSPQTTAPAVAAPTTSGPAGTTGSTFTTSGPIILVNGQTVTGLRISNPNGPCISGTNVSNVHIYNNKIGPCGPNAMDPGVLIQSNVHDIKIDHNTFDDVAGGALINSGTNNVIFDHNYATRIRGPFPRGQLVQFAAMNGSGHQITCNVSDQPTPGYGRGTEDHINMYRSSGTAASPILIKNNKIRGGGPSQSGGGLLAGDEASSYITIDSNILINPGQYGVGIAGGHNNRLINNKVFSTSFAWTNVGAYVWNQYAPSSYGHEVSGNRINWINRDGRQNSFEDGKNSGPIIMNNNVFGDSSVGNAIWNETFPECG